MQVIDDCIPKFEQDYFEAIALGYIEKGLPWTAKYESTAQQDGQKPISFKHVLKSSAEISSHFPNFVCIPQTVANSIGYTLEDIIFARAFLTIPYETDLQHHAPHTDLHYPHTSLIYYVNDADGDTVFFDDDNYIVEKVKPKKGRCVIFDGLIPHGAGIPSNGPRCIVNYNLHLGVINEQ